MIEATIWTSAFLLSIIMGLRVNNQYDANDLTLCGKGNDDGFGFGALLLIVGLILFYNSLKNLKKKRLLEDIPTSKMRSVAMGLVELKGKITESDRLIKDPFDDKNCVYWNVIIEEYVKRGKSYRWVTRHKASNSVPFLFSDETGSVLIVPGKADTTNVKRDNQYESAILDRKPLPLNIRQYCDQHKVKYKGWFGGKKTIRCRTTYLEPSDKLYIMGNARPITEEEASYIDSATAAIDYTKDGHFLISDKSEKELINEHGGQSWLVPLGITLSALGLGMILNEIRYF